MKRFKDDKTFTYAFLTSCFTGMRTGEVFALTWNDIDLEEGIIYVKHNCYDKPKDTKGRWYLGFNKKINGIRKVYIGDTLKKALINFKNYQYTFKRLYENAYKYYHLEDVKNEYGKVIEKRIVINTSADN